jgi:hypothetical protein
MSATFTVIQTAEIQVTGNNPTEENLVYTTPSLSVAPSVTDVVGNLGTIRVKTNSTGWDVVMTTDNGGKMLDKTSVGCVTVPVVDGWGNQTGATRDSCSTSGATYLAYNNGGTPANVVLDVAIGVAKQGKALGNTGTPNKLYPLLNAISGTPSFVAPVSIVPADIIASDINATTPAPVSFAEKIGTYYSTPANIPGAYLQGIYGNTTAATEGLWSDIALSGFPRPGVVSGTGLSTNVEPLEEYFYVNVGIPQATYNSLQGNKGTYTETFNFELVANF